MKVFRNALKAIDEDNVETFNEAIAKIEDINGILHQILEFIFIIFKSTSLSSSTKGKTTICRFTS